jgi:hypothetical protein
VNLCKDIETPLKIGVIYESDNSEQGGIFPFQQFTFIVLESYISNLGPRAKILMIEADSPVYKENVIYTIMPSYWLWTSAHELH